MKSTVTGLAIIIGALCIVGVFWFETQEEKGHELSDDEISLLLKEFVLPVTPVGELTQEDLEKISFGKALFFDKRLSINGEVACSSCHKPELNFTDGKPVAEAIGRGRRRTPSLLNARYKQWFFWDGRAATLAAQAMGPIENPIEQGFSRLGVVHLIREHYLKEYEVLYGPWPKVLGDGLPDHGLPALPKRFPPLTMCAYSLASLGSFSIQDKILQEAARVPVGAARYLCEKATQTPELPEEWFSAWERLTPEVQDKVNQVFLQVGEAIGAFESTLVATDSLFDRAVRGGDWKNHPEMLEGFKIFVGKGRCAFCHSGPMFTDEQFHNIGLGLRSDQTEPHSLDLGRVQGVVLAKQNQFHCLGVDATVRESCRELPYLDDANLELVGAFKTPSLRNLSARAPYGHDGRFPTVRSVLDHYNHLRDTPALGHREETLKPLGLRESELQVLEKFLKAL